MMWKFSKDKINIKVFKVIRQPTDTLTPGRYKAISSGRSRPAGFFIK
jgi:hypothetical protein